MDEPSAARPEASEALALESRRRIYQFIKGAPGSHLREIQRALGMPYGTAEYHLRALEEAALVRASHDGNLKRFFVADFAFTDRAVLGFLRKRPVRAVVVALLEKGELTHQELAAVAAIKPPTLSYHLPKLEAAHVVEVRHDGRFTRVRLADPRLMAKLLVTHGRSLGDEAVDRFLDTWAGFEFVAGTSPEATPGGRGGEGRGDVEEMEEEGMRRPRGK